MKKTNIIIIGLILVSFIIGIYLYPQMPDKMASHWNSKGEVDSYMPKFWGVFMMPIIVTGMYILFLFIPRIDPLKANIAKFRNYFDRFIIVIVAFMFYIYLLTIFWNLGFRFNLGQFMTPALGFLFIVAGILIKHAKRNYFIGIRTPWTLANEKVWNKTHKLGANLFFIAGVLCFFGTFFPDYMMWFVLGPVFTASFVTIIYSYFEFKKIKK